MTLKLYVNMGSQPCRAIVMFMKICKIPCEYVPVSLVDGEHRQEDFLKINPIGRVPVLQDDDFILTESIAIFQYLCDKYEIVDLYPADLKLRGKINEYLNWQHTNTRFWSAMVFQTEFIKSGVVSFDKIKGRIDFLPLDEALSRAKVMLDEFERMFIKSTPFIGGDKLSFADIVAVCELMQPEITGRDYLVNHPLMQAYVARVKQASNPHFDDAHRDVFNLRKNFTNQAVKA